MRNVFQTTDSVALTVLRVVTGVVFFAHGAQKALGWFGGHGFSGTVNAFQHGLGIPEPLAVLAIAAEFLGGVGLVLGLLGRVAAFGVFCNMAVAVLKVHLANGFFMNWEGTQRGEGFEFHLLAMAILVAVMIAGSGACSLDRLLSRAGHRPPTHDTFAPALR